MKELIETGCLWQDEDCKWENFFDGELNQENVAKFASTFCDRCLKVRQIGALEDLEELRDLNIRLGGIEDAIDRMDLDIPVGFGDKRVEKPVGYDERMERMHMNERYGRYDDEKFKYERRYPRYRGFGDFDERDDYLRHKR